MRKLKIIQTAAPSYRKRFFEEIKHHLQDDFELYSGDRYFENSVATDPSIERRVCNNHFFAGRCFLYQTGIWHLLFSRAVLVLEMNPRIISNWIFLILRHIAGKKTVLWGHAWPREGRHSRSDRLRHIMRVLASSIITYTLQQKEELQEKMPNKHIEAAPNALYSAQSMVTNEIESAPIHLIYVGRLTRGKKSFFMVKAFAQALPMLPEAMNLIVVGDGEEKQALVGYVSENNLEDRVLIKGSINDFKTLQKLYGTSLCSVSPGYVGLSVTQSFGFGVPMLVSRNENHSPEIEAVQEGQNAIFFETDDAVSFCQSILHLIENREFWTGQRKKIQGACRQNYSVEAMAKVFVNLVNIYA